MSGPYCATCKHFARQPLTPPDRGECGDPTKRIYSAAGNTVNEPPEVWDRFTCSNHETTGDSNGR